MQNAVIFGDGKCSPRTKVYKSALLLGEMLGARKYNIVNGGYFGVMEASAKGAASFGVERIGVIVKTYKSTPNKYLTQVIEVNSYLERLQKLIEMGTIYFVYPGGSGTLLELTALLALKERNLLKGNIFCIGKEWRKFQKFLYKDLKNFKNVSFKDFYFIEKMDELSRILFA